MIRRREFITLLGRSGVAARGARAAGSADTSRQRAHACE
jgi:hypothetical protein